MIEDACSICCMDRGNDKYSDCHCQSDLPAKTAAHVLDYVIPMV